MNKLLNKQWELSVISETVVLLWRHFDVAVIQRHSIHILSPNNNLTSGTQTREIR